MIIPQSFKGQRIGVFGLARSGEATLHALMAAGAHPIGFDDQEDRLKGQNTAQWQTYDFAALDGLVLSPGVPLTGDTRHPVLEKAAAAKLDISGDFDIFCAARPNLPRHKLVGITGTNGKSTTTALVTHLIRENGRDSVAFGNIGVPFLAVDPLSEDGVYVAELSSFQLDLSPAPSVNIAVLLNITPDHLDRHGTMDAYIAAKAKLFRVRKRKLIPIICVDDDPCRDIARTAGPYVVPISTQGIVPGGIWVSDGQLIDGLLPNPTVIGDMAHLTALRGQHNWQNALAAYAVGRRLGFAPKACFAALLSFAGLAHRQEVLHEADDCLPFDVINDSKATNWESAARALGTFSRIRWIAGGRLKGACPEFSRPDLSSPDSGGDNLGSVEKAYLYGEAGVDFQQRMPGSIPTGYHARFEDAVQAALDDAQAGETVVLSPAATAFDQFPDFEKRGDAFTALFRQFCTARKGKRP